MVNVARRSRVRRPLGPLRGGTKRAVDLALCLAVMPLAGPLILLLICLVRLSSPGPGLFRQERLGRGGEPFTKIGRASCRERV